MESTDKCERCGIKTENKIRMLHRTAHLCKECQIKLMKEVVKDLMNVK